MGTILIKPNIVIIIPLKYLKHNYQKKYKHIHNLAYL
jgi:hypothetical protein